MKSLKNKRALELKPTTAHYFNREYSWLQFNERVLDEAKNPHLPLLERLKFLAIFQANLDEFNMIRVASLKEHVRLGLKTVDSRTHLSAEEQLKMIYKKTGKLLREAAHVYRMIFAHPDLRQQQIGIFSYEQLTKQEQAEVNTYFQAAIRPSLAIHQVNRNTKVPRLKNQVLYIGAMLADEAFLIIQLPENAPRLIPLNEARTRFILLEELVKRHIPQVVEADLLTYSAFRVLRNYDLDLLYDEADDILASIQEQLEQRKKGFVIGLQIEHDEENRNFYIIKRLKEKLGIQDADVYEFVDAPIDVQFLFTFYTEVKAQYPQFAYQPLISQQPRMIAENESIMAQMENRDLYVHHPYESFTNSVVRFLAEAVADPDVREIHQTIYRLSADSQIALLLKQASEQGKRVSVLVELKARFDEQNNVEFAKECEACGIEVIYSEEKFKAHSKVLLVVKDDGTKRTYFTHIGTGNYNEQTAKLYTDCGLLTTNATIGKDALVYFAALRGHIRNVPLDYLVASPHHIAQKLMHLIEQEMLYHQLFGNGRIILKTNALTYQPVIDKLYEASQAGVQIDLIVRGICCLIPQLPLLSENIRVTSIVGRFLEHSRIYYFHHDGSQQVFLSSADLMGRNLERRYELAVPILDGEIKARIIAELDVMLSDNVKARELDHFGNYELKARSEAEQKIDSQLFFFAQAEQMQVTKPTTNQYFPGNKAVKSRWLPFFWRK